MRGLFVALRFLTILPVGTPRDSDNMSSSLIYFPFVGLVIGLGAAVLAGLIDGLVPTLVMASVVVIYMVVITGGLHWDGVADTCDGVFAPRTRDERLAIMKDSTVGAFGLIGVVLGLLFYFTLIAAIHPSLIVAIVLIVPVIGRWTMVLSIGLFPYARKEGIGGLFQKLPTVIILTTTFVTLALVLLALSLDGLMLAVGAVAVTLLFAWWISRRLGGLTGDIYGALGVLAELVFLFSVVIASSSGMFS